MADSSRITVVLLAAGRSSRMGAQHKLLLPLGGRPLIAYPVAAAHASQAAPVVVVLGHQAQAVRDALARADVTIVLNPAYAQGMATSLRAGIEAVPPSAQGAIITLGDQPLVTSSLLDALVHAALAAPDAIVATAYAQRRGTPVYFPRHLFGELALLSGDEGGRSVIAAHTDRVRTVEARFDEQGLDVDRPGEYARLLAEWDRYAQLIAG